MAAASVTAISSARGAEQPDADGRGAPPPRLSDGTVDLGGDGIWDLPNTRDFSTVLVNATKVPTLPWTRAMWDYNKANHAKYDPEGLCLPPGGPRAFGTPYPTQFIQQKKRILMIFEGGGHVWREIHMDGRQHPEGDALNLTYFGDSIGHWDGDTLVIDTIGYNERTWIGHAGLMHTDRLHTIEHITRPELSTLHYEATIDDPGAYSAAWTVAWNIPWNAGQELQEYICQENNQYITDLRDDLGQPFFRVTPK
jgi:hypothetical protein